MSNYLTYRHASKEDLPKVVEIYNSTVPTRMSTADTIPVTIESKQAWFDSHSPDNRPLWIVENNEAHTVGWVSFTSFSERPAYNGTVEISIYLDAAFRLKGMGKEILARAVNDAPNYGISNLIAKIFLHNEPSVRLFKQLGFVEWGLLPNVAVLDGKEASVIILGKQLY